MESLTPEELLAAAAKVEHREPLTDVRVKELLKMITTIGSTAAGSDEKRRNMLLQLKSSIVYHGCPLLFFTINPGERYSPIALYYAGEKIDIKSFLPYTYQLTERISIMLSNPLAVVEYFHTMVKVIIEKVLKGGLFGELGHHYGTIEYQGRYTPHIHMTVRSLPLSYC